ncbi:erythroid membrane-associated protein-like [Xiphophorus maculatus]|uniref:erythroid membrane-associated protein-like n=1 Tax=Xiphophorus maculatus TaxID=8083 RepID=UPI0003B36F5C|nr:erythroid membrane-associated protein-like [Xiphophorus maculatus]
MDCGWAPRFVSLSLVLLISASAEGKTITGAVGEDVILPCQASDYTPFQIVEWSRDGIHSEYVFVFDNTNPDLEITEQSYKGRVDVVDLEKGDVSLKLRNVKLEDSGRYECYVVRETNRKKRDIQPISTVYLHVAPPPPGRGHIGLVGLMVVAMVTALFAVIVWKKRTVSPPQGETPQTPPV